MSYFYNVFILFLYSSRWREWHNEPIFIIGPPLRNNLLSYFTPSVIVRFTDLLSASKVHYNNEILWDCPLYSTKYFTVITM